MLKSELGGKAVAELDQECALCEEEIDNEEDIYMLKCRHVCHDDCFEDHVQRRLKTKADFVCPRCTSK
jgi:hypothetical protein